MKEELKQRFVTTAQINYGRELSGTCTASSCKLEMIKSIFASTAGVMSCLP